MRRSDDAHCPGSSSIAHLPSTFRASIGASVASLGGGLHERLGALDVLRKAVLAVHMHAEVVPGSDVTFLDGFRPPLHGQRLIPLHALAVGEIGLRLRVACAGGLAEPRHRSFSVLLHAVAALKAMAEAALPFPVPLLGRLVVPRHPQESHDWHRTTGRCCRA